MKVFIDIETIPNQGNFNEYLEAAKADFKSPSSLTKTKACADLGLTGDDAKYTSKDDAIALWKKKFAEEKAPMVADEAWRKQALDGAKGEVWSIAWGVEGGDIQQIDRGSLNNLWDEGQFLQRFYDMLFGELSGKPAFFIGHNVVFDIKFLFHRSVINGVKPCCDMPFDGRHDNQYYCTMAAWAGYRDRISLNNLCEALGLPDKGDIDGSKVWDFIKAGDTEKVAEYNIDDVDKVIMIYNRLNFIK